ncbi:DNA polymerase III subunit gamma/tau [Paraburkholderia susongensis]|uniref:DNA-directed DNA polymerase n=1 Tax=Paraburkholderia susongensis TaxID=1515439 RepID=A0A1X7JAQ7_9BURK|nr:DNA polymerase III subunit gamma/tau [Paraburkholderia susongensis]SMG24554.1 DNA polymerase-3 subunit gamma/tau [Paraburkholderia susongensis]
MTYQVLARKWRPKDFASLVGQEHVVRALTHALDGGRLHHAYLFTGTRGVGKTTLSRIFAKALNCETGVTSTPCGVCRACREIDEGRFVDYVEMDAASNRGVDEMAALLERAVYAPVDARFKVYMIDEVHMLTNHAFNAMLKTLEEPPPHVKFILATTDPQKIPVTVLSRCLQFNLKQMPAGHIVSHLERILGEENVPYDAQALRLLARAADGSMRDALSLTDQAIAYSANQVSEDAVRGMLGALDQSYLIRLLDALAQGDGAAVLAIADEMALRSLSFSTALQDLASLLHRIAWAQFAPSSVLDEWPEAADLRRFADALSPEQVQLFYQIATIGRSELGLAPDEYAGFTMTLLRMLAFELAPNGGGGGDGTAGAGSQAGAAGAKRSGAPTVAALRALSGSSATAIVGGAASPAPAASARDAMPAAAPVRGTQTADAARDRDDAVKSAPIAQPAAGAAANTAQDTAAPQSRDAESATVSEPAQASDGATAVAACAGDTSPVVTERPLAPWEDAPANEDAAGARVNEPAPNELADAASASAQSAPTAPETAALARAQQAVSPEQEQEQEPEQPPSTTAPTPADSTPRRAGGASAALDVLRNAGLKVSSERNRASSATASAATAKPSAAPATPKPAAPRVVVPVPTPGAPRRAPQDAADTAADSAGAAAQPSPARSSATEPDGSSVPPWDDMPPDDYIPLSAADDGYFGPPDDNYVPVFDRGPDDVRMDRAAATAARSAATPPALDTRPLPPAVPLDSLGFSGDWPAFAVDLPLKGISYQLAFNSELMALDGSTLKLNVPVPQYAEVSQVAKLKAALIERLGRSVDVQVEVGPARRTAAAHDAAVRAQRQQEAEREIRADPFVQSLIREFGASIVDGSIRPITPDAAPNGAAPAH